MYDWICTLKKYFKPVATSTAQHTDRTIHNMDGTVKQRDSFVLLNTFDFLGLKPIADAAPQFKEVIDCTCEGVYCHQPYYIPVKHLTG